MDQGTNDTRRYLVDGAAFTLAEMLDANADTPDMCDALRAMTPGDDWSGSVLGGDDLHGLRVECVAVAS